MTQVTISPVTRVHGPLEIELEVAEGQVVEAKNSGLHFRGFELILQGRDPRDASYLAERICGICSAAHAVAAAMAIEDAAGVEVTPNGLLVRNMIFAADILQNHWRHYSLLVLPDYLNMPERSPYAAGRRARPLPPKLNQALLEDYREGINFSRLAHEIVAVFGGKQPHQHGIIPGGVTSLPTADRLRKTEAIVKEMHQAVASRHLPHFEELAAVYPEYARYGRGYGNLLNFGIFPKPGQKHAFYFPSGIVKNGKEIGPFRQEKIREEIVHSYYAGSGPLPPIQGETVPEYGKTGAYSWVKAPRYDGEPYEGGPLARLWITGKYRRGISALDRLQARLVEIESLCELMQEWVSLTHPDQPVFTPFAIPWEAEGMGLTGAMRGQLGHWVRIENAKITHYQIITPTAWNFSPRDARGQRGPAEEALIGVPVADLEDPVEVGRVIRSFDPCLSCATHLIDTHRRLEAEYVLES